MSADIQPIVMPKWGLAMQEGLLAAWLVDMGATIQKGQDILEIETSKIANTFESPLSGKLRRRVVEEGATVPVGALLGVCADEDVDEPSIDAFIADFNAAFEAEAKEAGEGAGAEPQTVEVGGQRLRYLKQGEAGGPPVIFIHGFGGDLNNWLFNQPAVAEKATTYALDLPGHGGSTKDVGPGTVDYLARTLVAFMEALGIAKAHLVGHSLGGAVALKLALDQPERVAGAVLVCPTGLGPEVSMEYVDGFIGASRRKKLEPVLQMLVADPSLVTGDMIEDVLKYKRLDGVGPALTTLRDAALGGGTQPLVMRDRLGELKVPVRIVWGGEDKVVPPGHGRDLPGTVPVTYLEQAGHLAHMEKAAEINAMILDSLT